MEFHALNSRLTQAAGDLQLHFACLAHYANGEASTAAIAEGVRIGSTAEQQEAAAEDLKQLHGQLTQIAEQVAAADEAAAQRAQVMENKMESAEESAKRRHDSVRSHLSQLEKALAVLLHQQSGVSGTSQPGAVPSLPSPSRKPESHRAINCLPTT